MYLQCYQRSCPAESFQFRPTINKAELVFRRGDFARFIAVLEKLSVDDEDFRKSYKA